MKTKLLFFLFLSGILSTQARILRVNNNGTTYTQYTGANVVYNDLQFAISSAIANDTIHVEASSLIYNLNPITIDKRLVIIGPGYLLGGNNGNVNLQNNSNKAILGELIFAATSAGSTVSGCFFQHQLWLKANNLTIKRNYFESRVNIDNFPSPISNLVFIQNYVKNVGFNTGGFLQTNSIGVTSAIISNNFFGQSFDINSSFNGIITNNVFAQGYPINFNGNQFYNNIVFSGTINSVGNSNTNIHHNLFTYAAPSFLSGTTTNVFSYPSASIFPTLGSDDAKLQPLSTCTPCLTSGVGNSQLGVFGGATGTQYRLSGIPEIPAIYFFNAPSQTLQGGTITVNVNTRSNN